MEIRSTFIAFVGVIEILIGLYVLVRGNRESSSRFFTSFAILTGLWVFVNSLNYTEFFVKATYSMGPFLAVTSLLWVESFSARELKRQVYYILYGVALFSGLAIHFTDLIVYYDTDLVSPVGALAGGFGPWYPIFALFVVGVLLFMLYLVHIGFHRAKGTKKSQLTFVFVGVYLFAVSVAFIDFILPIFGITSLINYDALTSLFFIGFSAYAILKFRLFSVKVFAVEALSIVITVIILIRLITSVDAEQIINGILFVFVMIFSFMLVRNTVKETKNRDKIERLAEDFVVANEQLRQIDKQKSDFISIASHQLRTPLTAIKGYASMIMEGSFGEVSGKAKEAVFKIFEANQRMIMTVENFLTMSRIERGKMFYKFEVIDFQKIVKDIVQELRPIASDHNLDINFRENKGRQYLINADFAKIKQVTHNLLTDSIHHTPKGFIDVFLTLSQYGDHVTLAISDTGEGATKEQLKNLFQKHSEIEDSQLNAAHKQGDGELYIVKEIVKDHRGEVWAESEGQGRGKTYFVQIPTLKNNVT